MMRVDPFLSHRVFGGILKPRFKILPSDLALLMVLPLVACGPGSDTPAESLSDYVGQTAPGLTAQLFAPGFVSTEDGELNSVFTPDFQEFYFTRRGVPVTPPRVLVTKRGPEGWSLPETVPFDERYSAIDLFITTDGEWMVFCSNRPREEGSPIRGDHDFWVSEKREDGWGEPRRFAPAAMSDFEDYYPVVTRSGNLYFNSQREGPGTNNIFRSSRVGGEYGPAEKLPGPVNSEYREFDAFVSPGEDLILFSSDRPGGFGRADIYFSVLEEGRWSNPRNLGEAVNSGSSEYGAMLTPDGRYLFFTSSRTGMEDIYWVSVDALGLPAR
jgi:hypothetical protein